MDSVTMTVSLADGAFISFTEKSYYAHGGSALSSLQVQIAGWKREGGFYHWSQDTGRVFYPWHSIKKITFKDETPS